MVLAIKFTNDERWYWPLNCDSQLTIASP